MSVKLIVRLFAGLEKLVVVKEFPETSVLVASSRLKAMAVSPPAKSRVRSFVPVMFSVLLGMSSKLIVIPSIVTAPSWKSPMPS